MVLKGEKLYTNALLAGSLGFLTFGWDAGVLGGVLLTDEFQSAMGVRLGLFTMLGRSTANSWIVVPRYDYRFHDNISFPVGIMAWLYDYLRLRYVAGKKDLDHDRLPRPSRGHDHFSCVFQLGPIDCG